MFNAEIPSRAELPSTAQLVNSTDRRRSRGGGHPGHGRAAGRVRDRSDRHRPRACAHADGRDQEAARHRSGKDRQKDRQQPAPATPDRRSGLPGFLADFLAGLLVSPAAAHPGGHDDDDDRTRSNRPRSLRWPLAQPAPTVAKTDEVRLHAEADEGIEYKMTMLRGGVVQFSWRVEGGKVNYDMHGTPKDGGKESSYKKASGVASDTGVLTAAYDGSHGWFWRNRTSKDVTVTLKVNGAYAEIRRMN